MPPVTTVPLPSIAAAPAELITGSGAVGPTGVATPPVIAAGVWTGTRLPATSACVEIDWVVVLASLTSSVNDGLLPAVSAKAQPLRAALPTSGIRQLTAELAIHFVNPLSRH